MEDAVDFIQSRPLIGYQMDGSHLNNVLLNLARQQQQLLHAQSQVTNRVAAMADDIREIRDHQKQLEALLGEIGGAEQLHHLRSRIAELEKAMDLVVRDVEETRGVTKTLGQEMTHAGRLSEEATRSVASLRDAVNALGSDMESLARQAGADRSSFGKTLSDIQGDRQVLEQRMRDSLREVQQRVERIEREGGAERLRQLLEELSDRTDENFRSIEESARAVDAELSRQNTAQAALRSDLNALDERARSAMLSLTNDTDSRYQMLLDAFRQYEQGWSDLEEHMVRAGQVLANRQSRSASVGIARR